MTNSFLGAQKYLLLSNLERFFFLFLNAAEISPLYCSLFGLFREQDRLWFPPSHIFHLDESAAEELFFRIRYAVFFNFAVLIQTHEPDFDLFDLFIATGIIFLAGTVMEHPSLIGMGSKKGQKAPSLMTL